MDEILIKAHATNELEQVLPAWKQLAEPGHGMSLFASPLWTIHYWEQRTRSGPPPQLLAGYLPDGQLVGVVPLTFLSRPRASVFATVRASHATGEYISDWCCAPRHASKFAAAVYDHLRHYSPGWFQLVATGVPEDSPVLAGLQRLCVDRHLSNEETSGPMVPVICVDGPESDALGLTTGKYRREILRRTREMEKIGELHVEEVRSMERLETCFNEFIAVEGSGWKARGGSAIASQPDARAFWWHFATEAAEVGRLRLHILRCGNRPIAGQLGVAWGDRYHCLKLGYDEEFRRYGPGAIMTQHVLQKSLDDPSLRVFDFSGVAQQYMSNWTKESYRTSNLVIAPPRFMPATAFRFRMSVKKAIRKWRKFATQNQQHADSGQ